MVFVPEMIGHVCKDECGNWVGIFGDTLFDTCLEAMEFLRFAVAELLPVSDADWQAFMSDVRSELVD